MDEKRTENTRKISMCLHVNLDAPSLCLIQSPPACHTFKADKGSSVYTLHTQQRACYAATARNTMLQTVGEAGIRKVFGFTQKIEFNGKPQPQPQNLKEISSEGYIRLTLADMNISADGEGSGCKHDRRRHDDGMAAQLYLWIGVEDVPVDHPAHWLHRLADVQILERDVHLLSGRGDHFCDGPPGPRSGEVFGGGLQGDRGTASEEECSVGDEVHHAAKMSREGTRCCCGLGECV